MRHSQAVDEGPALADEHRYLSKDGRALALDVAARLRDQGVQLDLVLTSPLPRAVQTAELLLRGLDAAIDVIAVPGLSAGLPLDFLLRRLSSYGARLAVVGHEPTLSALGALLVGRPGFPPFRPAQVALIEDGEPRWTLRPDTLGIDNLLVG
jgi:phosphohistidine phosphatase